MKFIDELKEKPSVQQAMKFFPAIAFLAGFGWDSVTLGQMVYGSDLLFLLAYYLGALVLVVLLSAHLEHPEGWTQERIMAARAEQKNLGMVLDKDIPPNAIVVRHHFLDREWSETWKNRFTWAVQFCFGGLFSALVVCYFKSSGSLASFILVIALACLLVGNEFLKKRYESFGVSLAFFCLLGTMFMNFSIPHLVHRIGFIWFFLSTLMSLGICVMIWKISRRSWKVLVAPVAISIILVVAYLMNWVPPVPLVMKNQLVCQNFDKKDYSCDVDAPGFLQKVGLAAPSVHRNPDNEVYVLTSVYAPAALKAEIEYLWYFKDPSSGSYKLTDKISSGRMIINGGREKGFRSYSKKKNVPEGEYRVETAFKDGAVIGSIAFKVYEEGRDSSYYVRKQLE